MVQNSYKLIIFGKKIYREIELFEDSDENITIGTTKDSNIRFNRDLFFDEFNLELCKIDNKWQLSCGESIFFTPDGIMKENIHDLSHGDELSIKYKEFNSEIFRISFLINFDSMKQNYERVIDIANKEQISIGGTENCDIYIHDENMKLEKVLLIKKEKGYCINEVVTVYGVYINGFRQLKNIYLNDYDFFMLGGYSFYIKESKLYTSNTENIIVNHLSCINISEQDNSLSYPHFNRSTRINFKIPDENIEIYPPEQKPTKPKRNLLLTLIPAIASLALVVVLRGMMGNGGSFVLYSVCTMLLGIIMSVVTYIVDIIQYKKEVKTREEKYISYINEKEQEIKLLREKELHIMGKIYTSIEEDIDRAKKFNRQLFERGKEDEDYLTVRIGSGQVKSKCETIYTKQKFKNTDDDLVNVPEQIEEKYKYIENAPIVVELNKANSVGVIGCDDKLYEMLKNFTVDIVTRHYYKDVKLYYIFSEKDINKFEWVHWLRHVDNEKLGVKNLIYDEESLNTNLELLYTEIIKREEENKQNDNLNIYDINYIVFVFNSSMIARHPITKYIDNARKYGFTFVFFENFMERLPRGCNQIIELNDDDSGLLHASENGEEIDSFKYPMVSDNIVSEISIKLASVYVDEVNLESELTKNISLFELLDLLTIKDLDLETRWNNSKVYNSMAVPLGVKKKGEIVYLDISDKASAHGPHGLVAGTTGSGKSEILQSYVLSIASLFHPYDIGFVIIDFKGGGMANQFENLPHLMGAITNIDGREINRSLLSIKSELIRRQEIFAQYKVNHINDYIKMFKEGKTEQPLPHLIMIVDEFAELKSEYPEFMKEIISAARIGRTLGIHLILATQKPAGVVDNQVWSNSKFKLCLKVQTREDSSEMIKTPLASEIVEPGRAYFQVGNNEIFELFQSAYSGAKVLDDDGQNQEKIEIYTKNIWGKKSLIYTNQTRRQDKDAKNQLEVMVEYINDFCKVNGIPRLPGICLPPLSDIIFLSDLQQEHETNLLDGITISIGIFDDPELQLQEELKLNLSENNTYIIGAAQMGKTNLLLTTIYGLIEKYTPNQVNIYAVDCGNMALKVFESSNHVGGVTLVTEEEKVINLFKMLTQTVERRKEIFSEKGLGTYKAYIEAGYNDLPYIILVIDNIAVFKEYYSDLDDVFLKLSREGQSVGISIIVTSTLSNAISYKVMPNFSSKIALNCNDKGEYSNLFSRCKIEPKEIPGRGLCMVEKRVVEFQVALPVKEQKEFQRVAKLKEMIELRNTLFISCKAIPIPVVPEIIINSNLHMDRKDIYSNSYIVPIGIEYETVSYYLLNLLSLGMMAVLGREKSGRTNFVKQILSTIQFDIFKHYTEVYVFDSSDRQFDSVKDYNIVKEYTIDPSCCEVIFEKINDELLRRKELVENRIQNQTVEEILSDLPLQLIIIENASLINSINSDKKLLEYITEFTKTLKNMKVCIIFSNIENTQVSYSSGDLIKAIKENRKAILFDDVSNIKFFDVSLKQQKEYAKNIVLGDSYIFMGNDFKKVKTILDE
ncbi:type VII secretion protein EssC [Anaeromicropila herbilytica]|uniref:Type VII secretion protein EssC n=1 Tax=Anaeromicropila herbilytica TaxID=2785025 RepID=A0A7R7EP23_9FIRM|nr:type VII secretion protein EssC [Anaeromicropila herbilytica]BCN32353.1 type VII secretion protein EssC [Anaeromicropila herbilytica]